MALTKRVPLAREQIVAELEEFELRYGVPSERLREPFTHNGRLDETADFRRWSFLQGIALRLEVPARGRCA
jgi:hypothetical protein